MIQNLFDYLFKHKTYQTYKTNHCAVIRADVTSQEGWKNTDRTEMKKIHCTISFTFSIVTRDHMYEVTKYSGNTCNIHLCMTRNHIPPFDKKKKETNTAALKCPTMPYHSSRLLFI